MDRSQWRRSIEFVDPRTTPFVAMRSRGELPHLYKEGGSYFVTFRLRDAVVPGKSCGAGVPPASDYRAGVPPAPKKKGAGGTPAPQGAATSSPQLLAREVAVINEPPLRMGECTLARPEIATVVEDTLLFFHAQRHILVAWCVMPNHVHAVFTVLAQSEASDILHSWKSYTAHKINRILGTHGTLWERESFDHLIRSFDDFEYFIRYVENNPVTAGFVRFPHEWRFSSAYSHCGAGVPPAPAHGSAGGTPAPQWDRRG